jgi:hypothetical protein
MGIILICRSARLYQRGGGSIGGDSPVLAATAPFRAVGRIAAMCVQCMVTAMSSVAAASGTRAWLGRKRAEWLTPKVLRFITIALFRRVARGRAMSGSS